MLVVLTYLRQCLTKRYPVKFVQVTTGQIFEGLVIESVLMQSQGLKFGESLEAGQLL